jgi:hypothetical protein
MPDTSEYPVILNCLAGVNVLLCPDFSNHKQTQAFTGTTEVHRITKT